MGVEFRIWRRFGFGAGGYTVTTVACVGARYRNGREPW